METLRIGMFSWESLHSVTVGGISPHVTELAETLSAKGHEVHIFTQSGWMRDYDLINGVHYQRCRYNSSGGIVHQMDQMCNAMYDRFGSVQKEFGEFDVLHGHDWHPVNALTRIKQEYSKQFVVTYHSTEWGRNGNQQGYWWEAREISHREWLGGYEAKETIITTDQFKVEVQHLYQIPDYKISVIPNGINPGKIEKDVDAGAVKKRFGIHPYAPVVLYTGRICHQKGVDILIDAIPEILNNRWDARFVFIGDGGMRQYCEHRASELGVRDACRFLGRVSDETLSCCMNSCDLACVPSRNEPFGIVVLEAWDAAKPVIATDAVHLIDNFSNGITGYKNPQSIAWCVNYSMGDLEATKKMGQNGKELVETKYNWDRIADDTVKVYQRLDG